jgi:hypothetical protein
VVRTLRRQEAGLNRRGFNRTRCPSEGAERLQMPHEDQEDG